MKKLTLISLVLFFIISLVFKTEAQKITIVSGNLNFLKDAGTIKAEYIFDGMKVGDKTEEAYIEQKVKEKNKENEGDGEKWLESWNRDKSARYQPKFEELFNEIMAKKNIKIDNSATDSKYTMIVKTLRLEPGYNVGIMRADAEIDVEISIVETANPSNVLCKMKVMKAPGRIYGGMDFDTGTRIAEAYAKCAKELAAYMVKKFPK